MKKSRTVQVKPAGSKDVLPPVTDGERRNGWDAHGLDAFLRGSFNGDPYNYRREIHTRWAHHAGLAQAAVAKWKSERDLSDPAEKGELNRLELHAAHCLAMANRAADLVDNL